MICGMAISSPNVLSPEEQLDRKVHHVRPDNVAEKVVLVGGDDRLDPVEVAEVVVGGGPDQLNCALSSSSARRLLVESTKNETYKYKFNYQIDKNEIDISWYHVEIKYKGSISYHQQIEPQ